MSLAGNLPDHEAVVQNEEKSSFVAVSETPDHFAVGTIIYLFYCTNEPRWYRIVKETDKVFQAERLYAKLGPDVDRFNNKINRPSSTATTQIIRINKKEPLSYQGSVVKEYNSIEWDLLHKLKTSNVDLLRTT